MDNIVLKKIWEDDGFYKISICVTSSEISINNSTFVNHSDIAGGSTLGNILTSQMDINGVDVGAPIWAMHSALETAGVGDHLGMVNVFKSFWQLKCRLL